MYNNTISLPVTKKMLRAIARLSSVDPERYRKYGRGMTGVVRAALQNEIDRQKEREKALREYFMSPA